MVHAPHYLPKILEVLHLETHLSPNVLDERLWTWMFMKVKVFHSVDLTLCHPLDCSPLGSSIHGLQTGILEWVAMPISRGSS